MSLEAEELWVLDISGMFPECCMKSVLTLVSKVIAICTASHAPALHGSSRTQPPKLDGKDGGSPVLFLPTLVHQQVLPF